MLPRRGGRGRESERRWKREAREGTSELTIFSFPSLPFESFLLFDALDTISKWSTHISATYPLLQANLFHPAPVLAHNIFNVVRLVRTCPSPSPSSSSSPPPEDCSAGLFIGSIRIWTPHDKKSDADKFGVMNVSYYLLQEYTGMGVMGEVVGALVRFWEVWEGGEESKRVRIWEANGQ